MRSASARTPEIYCIPRGAHSYLRIHGHCRIHLPAVLLPFNTSHLPLRRQVLDKVPFDFVGFPGTRDVAYIAQTTPGLTST